MSRELLKRVIAECGDDRSGSNITPKLYGAIAEYLEMPEPEPVAWRALNFAEHGGVYAYRDHDEPFVGVSGSNVGEPLYTTPPDQSARIVELKAALQLAKDMMIANDLSLPRTFEVIDEALAKAKEEV